MSTRNPAEGYEWNQAAQVNESPIDDLIICRVRASFLQTTRQEVLSANTAVFSAGLSDQRFRMIAFPGTNSCRK